MSDINEINPKSRQLIILQDFIYLQVIDGIAKIIELEGASAVASILGDIELALDEAYVDKDSPVVADTLLSTSKLIGDVRKQIEQLSFVS